jgi:hypothetical protein
MSWATFCKWLKGYFQEGARRRQQLIFRGQRDASWKLRPTLDRLYSFGSDEERNQFTGKLIDEFRRELMHVEPRDVELEGSAMDLLARHQGLPSLLMDWTESPYIAAFFAFAGCTDQDKHQVAIWQLDRAKLGDAPALEIIDDPSMLRFNQRAIRQRGVFIRLGTGAAFEEQVGNALTQIRVPAGQFQAALSELDEMTINATYLFPDMEGAARTAHFRAASWRSEQ